MRTIPDDPGLSPALQFHAAFAGVCALALAAPVGVAPGPRMAALVLGYHLAFLAFARARGRADWLDLWAFLLPLSLLQVLPDWFLSAQLGVLVFPEDGLPKLGTVAPYMAGLWVIPLLVTLLIARAVDRRYGAAAGLLAAGGVAVTIFAGAEATMWAIPAWHARGVFTVLHIAVYVLPAELALGMAAHVAYAAVEGRRLPAKLVAALAVMLLYTGALSVSYLVIERVIVRGDGDRAADPLPPPPLARM
jgi:hypothetical protein